MNSPCRFPGGTGYTFGMKNTLLVFVICIAAILVGAFLFFYNPKDLTGRDAADQSANVSTAPVAEVQVAFTVLETGQQAVEVAERKNVAARDAASFQRLWTMAHGGQEMAAPEVDFTKEYVIGVFAGEKTTGGHMIEVLSVTDFGDQRTLSVTQTAPGEGCAVSQAFTSPYQLIRVPVSTNYLRAVDTAVESPCQ